jgi:rhamnosyl/mannosyltransferase
VRVLIVASELPPIVSGVARSVSELARGLRILGHDVETLSAADSRLYFARGDVRLSGIALRLPALAGRLEDFDVVNVHGPAPMISDSFLLALSSIPRARRPLLVYTHHFTIELSQRWMQPMLRSYEVLTKRLARRADHVVVTSRSYADLIQAGQPDLEVSVVPWTVDVRRSCVKGRETYTADRDLRVLYVGQLREYKGAHVAVGAVAGVDGIRLTVIGRGPRDASLRTQVIESGSTNVEIRGYVTDDELDDAYRSHDVVLLPSINRLEAFGIALVEGMAAGCVPVASDLPGVRDVVEGCGLLAAPGDVDDLRWALSLLVGNPEMVAAFGERARERAAQFIKSEPADSYDALFRRLLGAVEPAAARGC